MGAVVVDMPEATPAAVGMAEAAAGMGAITAVMDIMADIMAMDTMVTDTTVTDTMAGAIPIGAGAGAGVGHGGEVIMGTHTILTLTHTTAMAIPTRAPTVILIHTNPRTASFRRRASHSSTTGISAKIRKVIILM